KGAAEWVREHREPADQGNPLALVQEAMSRQIVAGLDVYRDLRDRFGEQLFLAVYGSPMLQAACGIDPKDTKPLRKAQKSLMHRELIEKRIAELRAKFEIGGLREALIRSMLY